MEIGMFLLKSTNLNALNNVFFYSMNLDFFIFTKRTENAV